MSDFSTPVPPPFSAPPRGPSTHDKSLAMLCHLLAFAGYVVPVAGNLLGPLVMWLTQREKSAFADYHGKESLNFQITVSIALALALCFAFAFTFAFGWILIGLLGIPAMFALLIYDTVMTIIAAIKANEGVHYRYPFTLRLIK